jgi:hypothetical protein
MTNAVYSFLPWYRRGIGGLIANALPAGAQRASVQVAVGVRAEPAGGAPQTATVTKRVDVYGPGDVVGIDLRAIIRKDPDHWVTSAEPNYLAQIEFYEEDLPWRYSPEAPSAGGLRLTPWIALAVLAETEFEEGRDLAVRPLPHVKVAGYDPFPPPRELWAWAHVHVNAALSATDDEFVSPDMAAVLPRFEALLAADPDIAYSRVICPRRLQPSTAYHAFLIPSFEAGRLAGLGLPLATVPSGTTGTWEAYANRPEPLLIPFYHRWFFRTAEAGDFESLVRRLKPRPIDPSVGYRQVDVTRPGLNLPAIDTPAPGGVLMLGGALRAPEAVLSPAERAARSAFETWDQPGPHRFQRALTALINLGDDYVRTPAAAAHNRIVNGPQPEDQVDLGSVAEDGADEDVSPDPLVLPPLYGRWHAAVSRLLVDAAGAAVPNTDNWVHALNLDPRHRVVAAAGTTVIQRGQEEYMDAAWEQVGAVLEANRTLRLTRYATEVSAGWHARRFDVATLGNARFLRLTRPVHRRVLSAGASVRSALDRGLISASAVSFTASRALRPGGRLARMAAEGKGLDAEKMLGDLNDGRIRIARPKRSPTGLLTVEILAEKSVPAAIEAGRVPVSRARAAVDMARLLGDPGASAEGFLGIPRLVSIAIGEPEDDRRDQTRVARDETERFVDAGAAWFDLVGASHQAARRLQRDQVNLVAVTTAIDTTLDPRLTLRRRALGRVKIPPHILAELPDTFDEIMHHPVIDTPMYKPLEQVSKDYLMPGLSLVEQNSITTVTTNQAVVEAYMVGLNHEFGRELLWRGYPTDQRGSVFRQFWDVRGQIAPANVDPEAFRESFRDIPKIHRWPDDSTLGQHDNREDPARQGENIVLLIRGELLKKYPNAVLYAHRAEWTLDGAGQPDTSRERRLVNVPEASLANPPRHAMRFPLFDAKVEDIYFFGFDLAEDEAKGRAAGPATPDNAGWFFVLKERPGEPRFGFDTSRDGPLQTVNDIVWADLLPPGSSRQFIDPAVAMPALAPLGTADQEKALQREDDLKILTATASAARWAYLLYQAPVMVAIHAAEMLKQG